MARAACKRGKFCFDPFLSFFFFFAQNGSPSFYPIDLLVSHYGPLIINWNYWHFVPHHVVFSVYKYCSLIVPLTYGFYGWGNCSIINLFLFSRTHKFLLFLWELSEYDYVQEPCIIHNLSFALLFTYLALCYFILFVVLYSVFIAFCSIY